MRQPVRRQMPYRGPINSRDFNESVSEMAELAATMREMVDEQNMRLDRRSVDALINKGSGTKAWKTYEKQKKIEEALGLWEAVEDETPILKTYSFYDSVGLHYTLDQGGGTVEGYELQNRLYLDTRYGEVTLPIIGLKSLFWTPTTDEVDEVVLQDLQVSTQDLSPLAGVVEKSNYRNAFDSTTLDPFLIRASYPIDSNIDEVTFNINVVVPQSLSRVANMLTIEPSPEIGCHVTGIKYSGSSLVASNDIPGLPIINKNNPLYDTAPVRFIFDPVEVLSLQVQLSTRNFVYENGRKVFYIGLRELGLYEAEFDSNWSNTGAGVFTNNGLLVKLQLPTMQGISPIDVAFDRLVGLRTSQPLSTNTSASGTRTGIRVMVYDDDALSNRIYDSLTDGLLSEANDVTVSGDKQHLWIAVEMDRHNVNNVIPILRGMSVKYTVK
jgi:hypothetical protein